MTWVDLFHKGLHSTQSHRTNVRDDAEHSTDLSPLPHRPAQSGFKLNLTPHTWPFGLGLVQDEQREAGEQLWGRVHNKAYSTLTKAEIQLERISVQVVEYHSLQLTGNIFSSALKAASINL